jgi:hypothetical protein
MCLEFARIAFWRIFFDKPMVLLQIAKHLLCSIEESMDFRARDIQ